MNDILFSTGTLQRSTLQGSNVLLQGTSTQVMNNYPPEMFQDEGESPLTKILNNVKEENLPVARSMTLATCGKTDILFSTGTLQQSTLQTQMKLCHWTQGI